jgi:phage shock protein PspC (stress-responsive transcriptional regulator)
MILGRGKREIGFCGGYANYWGWLREGVVLHLLSILFVNLFKTFGILFVRDRF